MEENLEVVREVWGINLSAQRNRIIRINLLVTVAAFAATVAIVPASFFGMNLPHGLEVRCSGSIASLPAPFCLQIPSGGSVTVQSLAQDREGVGVVSMLKHAIGNGV